MAGRGRADEIDGVLDTLATKLLDLAQNTSEHAAIREAGLLPFLGALMGEKQPDVRKTKAARTITLLAREPNLSALHGRRRARYGRSRAHTCVCAELVGQIALASKSSSIRRHLVGASRWRDGRCVAYRIL